MIPMHCMITKERRACSENGNRIAAGRLETLASWNESKLELSFSTKSNPLPGHTNPSIFTYGRRDIAKCGCLTLVQLARNCPSRAVEQGVPQLNDITLCNQESSPVVFMFSNVQESINFYSGALTAIRRQRKSHAETRDIDKTQAFKMSWIAQVRLTRNPSIPIILLKQRAVDVGFQKLVLRSQHHQSLNQKRRERPSNWNLIRCGHQLHSNYRSRPHPPRRDNRRHRSSR